MGSDVALLLYKKKLIILLMMILRKRAQNQKTRLRRWAVHPSRKRAKFVSKNTQATEMYCEPDNMRQCTYMTQRQFNMLTELIRPHITKKYRGDNFVDAGYRLAIAVRFLATGDSYLSLSHEFRVGITTVHQIVKEVCAALWIVLQPKYLPPPTPDIWKRSAEGYHKIWNFPLCCGSVDGRNIIMHQPGASSLVLIGVVDPNCKFIAVDIGSYGSNTGGIWNNCRLGQSLENGALELPGKTNLPGTDITVPHVLLGNEEFSLQPNFLSPYSKSDFTQLTQTYNYRLHRARCCSECAFGILGCRWRIFRRPLMLNSANSEQVVKAVVVLHNFLMTDIAEDENVYCPPGYADHPDDSGKIHPGSWRVDDVESKALQPAFNNNARQLYQQTNDVQNQFARYFVRESDINFQWNSDPLEHR